MINLSSVMTTLALVSSVAHSFRPSYMTELLLWGACVVFIYERDYRKYAR